MEYQGISEFSQWNTSYNRCFCNFFDRWSLRLHVESSKTPKFLGGSVLGVMRESPMFRPMCLFWLVLLWVVITISSVLSSFSFKRLLVIHIFISLIQASGQDIAVYFDTDTSSWKEIYNWVSPRKDESSTHVSNNIPKRGSVFVIIWIAWVMLLYIYNKMKIRYFGHKIEFNYLHQNFPKWQSVSQICSFPECQCIGLCIWEIKYLTFLNNIAMIQLTWRKNPVFSP